MGQHTWCSKHIKLYKACHLLDDLEEPDSGMPEEITSKVIEINLDLWGISSSEYHDVFRSFKKESDDSYCEDIITSREACEAYLEENKKYIFNINKEQIDAFWDEYPSGVISFG